MDSFKPLTPQLVTKWTPRLLTEVCWNLSVSDLCKFCQVSRAFRDAAYNEVLWKARIDNVYRSTKKKTQSEGLIGDPATPLNVLDTLVHTGNSRVDFMKIFKALAPFYYNLVKSGRHQEPHIFQTYKETIDQAKILNQLNRFCLADPWEANHETNKSVVTITIDLFESTLLGEFEKAYDGKDHERVKQYSSVLIALNGGQSCVDVYLEKHQPQQFTENQISADFFTFESKNLDTIKIQDYLRGLASILNQEFVRINGVFPPELSVSFLLFEKILQEGIMNLFNSIISFTMDNNRTSQRYLNVVPDLYNNLMWFKKQLNTKTCGEDFDDKVTKTINELYSIYIDTHLTDEVQLFIEQAEDQVMKWNNEVQEEEKATETFLWSNVNKQQEKSDILTSFKKVLLMPVSVITTSSASTKSSTPSPTMVSPSRPISPMTTPTPPPTNELDAMVAVMDNKIQGIKTLLSLELAINILKQGKESIERLQTFSFEGEKVMRQSQRIFVEIIRILGRNHIKLGFDRALDTLNKYNPRQLRRVMTDDSGSQSAVEPLAIFAELVNIGDLIQQMIHAFFEQELNARKLIDKNDFLDPAEQAKKKFESTLDDSVANGLNRGIDVLIDQIDFVLITTQLGSDYNPIPDSVLDIGPTEAAIRVVTLLSSHINLLVGSTDKSVIDVFQQEVGVRFYGSICKHLKRQSISVDGSIKLISDLNHYYNFILSLKQYQIMPYFIALKEVGQLFLIDGRHDAKELGKTLSDMSRFRGVLQPEEVYEFVQRRADWPLVRKEVERVMYGFGIDCFLM